MQAIAYIRVSTEGQATEGSSLEAQQERIAAWCIANGYTLADTFVDAGISGKNMKNRPGLQAALAACKKGTALVVYSLSRLARSTRDTLEIAERLEKTGADMVSLSERIDTSGAAGKMMFRMLAVLAEFERDVISERTQGVLTHLKATGKAYTRDVYGFANVEGRLEAVESEVAVVAEILAQRSAGHTLAQIAEDLNQRGIEGKRGGKWYASTVAYVVKRQQVQA